MTVTQNTNWTYRPTNKVTSSVETKIHIQHDGSCLLVNLNMHLCQNHFHMYVYVGHIEYYPPQTSAHGLNCQSRFISLAWD